jgi:hypothetical protein
MLYIPTSPLKMRMNIHHSHLAKKMMKIETTERFGENINQLKSGRNMNDFNQTLLQFLPNEMTIELYMFSSFMVYWI